MKSLAAICFYTHILLLIPQSFALTHISLPMGLRKNDIVGLISSGFPVQKPNLKLAAERMKKLGLQVIYGNSVLKQAGYFAGTDKQRAADINAMFANKKVKAIIELRGGWGSARTLPYLNYKTIKENPKIFMGFSDITTLLVAIYAKTGLITFHGPMAAAFPWTHYTVNYVKKILFQGKAVTLRNPVIKTDCSKKTYIQTIYPGTVTGRIIGGNLTVLVAMLGSHYLPSFKHKILFVEDVGEEVYKIDRMLTQLQMAGILQQLSGFIFGQCINCSANIHPGSYRLNEVIAQHIQPLKIPAWSGAMIGHQANMFTIGEGSIVKINANKGTITMLKPAVT